MFSNILSAERTKKQRLWEARTNLMPWFWFLIPFSNQQIQSSSEKLLILGLGQERIRWTWGNFPAGLVVKTLPSSAGGVGSVPGWEAMVWHASGPKKPKHKTGVILQKKFNKLLKKKKKKDEPGALCSDKNIKVTHKKNNHTGMWVWQGTRSQLGRF